ncbi:MAG: response regulator [Cellvibrionaceae bacterium]
MALDEQQAQLDSQLSSVRILLAEDNLVNQKVAATILERKKISVVIANNGKEAVEILIKHPQDFDLVLMDMDMPIMDGYEATKTIRELKKFQKLPIVALTAHSSPQDKDKCLSAGMNDHVSKPVKPDTLYNSILRNVHPDNNEHSINNAHTQ